MLTFLPHRLCLTGPLAASLWFLLAIPTITIVVLNSVQKVNELNGSFVANCDYSVELLLLVLAVHIVVGVFLIFWFSRCCKRCNKKTVKRASAAMLCIVVLLYTVAVAGFAASIIPYVNDVRQNSSPAINGSRNNINGSGDGVMGGSGSGSGSGTIEYSGSGGGGGGSGGGSGSGSGMNGSIESGSGLNDSFPSNHTTNEISEHICIEFSSEAFLFVVVFFALLCVFIVAVSCVFCYECSHYGFCYQRVHYDPTVIVIENETAFNS